MTRISVGDASMTNILARQGADLRAQVQRAAQEVATGRHTDIGQVMRGDLSPLLAVDASLARLAAYRTNTTDAAFRAVYEIDPQFNLVEHLEHVAELYGVTVFSEDMLAHFLGVAPLR